MTEKKLQDQNTEQENKMGVLPVRKLLISMSLPMMASMLVQALYNIVDSIFVARLSENALTAVSMAFPLQTLMISLAGGTGVGVNAILSKALGEKEFDKANKAAENGIFLSIIGYLVFLVVGFTAVRPFYMSQTSDPEIIEYGVQYLTIALTLSFGVFGQFIFERILTSTGRTFYTMLTQGTGAIVNIILDPIFIFGMFGLPKMGTAGAAVATVIGQITAACFALYLNLRKNPDVKLSAKGFRPDGAMIGRIYRIGVPSIIMMSIGSVMTYTMNKILMAFSSTAVAVFGVYFKLQSFIFMPVFGLNNGLVPIVAYNFGAKKKDRMMESWKLAWIYATAILVFGVILFEAVPRTLLGMFDASEYMMGIGTVALRVIAVHFPFAAYCIVTGSMFQALGHSVYSMITSIMRQLVVLIPAAFLLSLPGNVDYVWWSFPIAELMSAMATTFFFVILYRKVISGIGKEPAPAEEA
ncbi:MAG: MATE family efflux transporter [Lachnospiraceae bacterium]|nr:MATE family efflux transporter [Lachnospiraceae bacterium]